MLIVAAHDVEQPCRVVAHFLAQVAQSDELARAGRHLRLFPAAEQRHELHQAHFEGLDRAAERSQAGAQPGDIAVMIGAPDVQQMIEAALQFVEDIGNVRRKIRLDAVLADHHAILLVAVVGTLEPQRAVLEVGVSALFQGIDRALHRTVVAQGALGKPAIEGDAEFAQILADVAQDFPERQIEHAAECGFADERPRAGNERIDVRVLIASLRLIRRQILEDFGRAMPQAQAFRGEQAFADRGDVVAPIAVRGKGEALAALFQIPQPRAHRQDFHLASRIVDVVLALHAPAHRLQQIRDRRTERGMAAVAHVQRARGICRHEFHLHRSPAARRRPAVPAPLAQHLADLRVIGVIRQEEIDEAGARDLDFGDRRARRQPAHQRLRQFARILARCLGEPHGKVAREIAVLRVARVLDLDARTARAERHQVFRQRCQGLRQQFFDQCLQGGSKVSRSTKGRQFSAARARNPLNPLRADRRRSTSAGRAAPAAHPPAPANS